ncbi:MAG: hypothetical protein ACPGJV_04735 [Bacteriovoracaceae bacterium]
MTTQKFFRFFVLAIFVLPLTLNAHSHQESLRVEGPMKEMANECDANTNCFEIELRCNKAQKRQR